MSNKYITFDFQKNIIRRIKKSLARRSATFSSIEYWERRYKKGGTSGSGSYGRLAEWKASVINDWVQSKGIKRVLELGSGDGNQLSLASYNKYIGFDVSITSLNLCRELFRDRDWQFHEYSPESVHLMSIKFKPQIALSLDVLYHLVEDDVYNDYMQALFSTNGDFIVIYSSNGNMNVENAHIKNRIFTDWIAAYAPKWELISKIDNPYPYESSSPDETSFADFYIYSR